MARISFRAAARAPLLALLLLASPAVAQMAVPVIAVPPLPTPRNEPTDAGDTGVIGIQVATQIAADLRASGIAVPVGPEGARTYTATEAQAPNFPAWSATGASSIVTGYVQRRDDGRLAIVCYVYDLKTRREAGRTGFVLAASDWRRAAHRCADVAYAHLSGGPGYFDTRIAYVAESGGLQRRVKRLAIMDLDGSNHRYLSAGETSVVGPRFSPDGSRLAYVAFAGGRAQVRLLSVADGTDRPLLETPAISFAPAFSPDGRRIAFALAAQGNSDIFVMDVDGGFPQQLTAAPGSDTAPSFSPDGSRILFESSRSGTPQLYVMNADGSDQRRLSFVPGATYSAPVWSPAGDLIAFVRSDGNTSRIGLMDANGGSERLLTDGWQDEAPSWAPGGRALVFQRRERGSGRVSLLQVSIAGGTPQPLTTPQDASDPSWSPPRN
jgi:TolB protein